MREDIKIRKLLHHKICNLIMSHGDSTPKIKHGNLWELRMSNLWRFKLDDYSYSLTLYTPGLVDVGEEIKTYIGIDFGGFESKLDKEAYKRILGTIAICFWKSRKPV